MSSVTRGWLGVGANVKDRYWFKPEHYTGTFKDTYDKGTRLGNVSCFHVTSKRHMWGWDAFGSSIPIKAPLPNYVPTKTLRHMKLLKLPNGKEFLL